MLGSCRCFLGGSTLSLVQATVSTSHVRPQGTRHRLVWVSWLLFVLLIVNSLNGTIVTQLTKPLYSHKINTLKDLLKSGERLYTEIRGFPNERYDPVVSALAAKMLDVYIHHPVIAEFNRAALLTSTNTRTVLTVLNKNGDHDFYVIPEMMDQVLSGYLMSPRNPAFDTFKRTLTTLLETGFYAKWTREYINNVTLNKKRYYFYFLYNSTGGRDETSAMNMEELMLAFRLHLIGSLLAFVVFLGEILVSEFLRHINN